MRRRSNQFVLRAAALLALGALLSGVAAWSQIRREVNLVVVHTAVVDKTGHFVLDLLKKDFEVREDGVKQPLSLFRKEAVPVTVGLVLDNSASMAHKREKMMAGALSFVEVFNKEDEFFVVNFNSDYYLDLEGKDFTNSTDEVRTALDRTNTRGQTAIFDALRASINHIRGGTRQKKVLLTISDGVDNSSYSDFDTLYEEAQKSEVGLYFVVLPCSGDDEKRECRSAKRQVRKLSAATGGMAYFPETLNDVVALGRQIADDVRSQYVLGYNPANRTRDGRYRRLEVKIRKQRGRKKLEARHRPGYYAKTDHQGSR
jgi:VWFA-related protein